MNRRLCRRSGSPHEADVHLPVAQLMFADLLHLVSAHTKPPRQLCQTHPAALVGWQNPATQIAGKRSCHPFLPQSISPFAAYPEFLAEGITT